MKRMIGVIWEEDDYDVFKKMVGNRDVSENRKNTLKASIAEKYIMSPLCVNEKMQIVDGQGRFEALRELHKPIHYYEAIGAGIEDCQRMNKANTNWSLIDIVKSYSKSGNDNYTRLLTACDFYKLDLGTVLKLSGKSAGGAGISTFVESGRLLFTSDDIDTVRASAEKIREVYAVLKPGESPAKRFFSVMKVMIETDGYNQEQMLRGCGYNRMKYTPCARFGDEMKQLEEFYNYRNRSRINFCEYMRNKGANVRDYTKEREEDRNIQTLKIAK